MKNEYSVESFIRDQLVKLVSDFTSLNAMFISYRPIGEYQDGLVKTNKDGLQIFVSKGKEANQDLAALGIWTLAHGTIEEDVAYHNTCQRIATNEVAGVVGKIPSERKSDVLVIYLGLSGFNAAVEFIRKTKETIPAMKVVAVTCDCDLESKRPTASLLIASGEIDYFVVTKGCGGTGAMSKILEAMIETWPSKEPVPA
ncbi:MAG: hypothetical protein WC631_01290 [Candidatus Paceibacterota bacterium]